jgi:serine/threonine protein phosphatase PrpC
MRYRWVTRTHVGRMRDHNEDAVWPEAGKSGEDERLVVAVADGMGGHVGGEVASRTAIETASVAPGPAAVRVQAANVAVRDTAARQPRLRGMGTTLTLAIFEDGRAELGHVGDSRAYLMRDGALTQVTSDHSYVAEMIAAGRMTPEEADVHPYRSVLLRAVGLESDVEVDALEVELAVGDRFLICSDGVTSMISDEEISACLGEAYSAEESADALIAAANSAGGADNITVVVVEMV